MRNEDKLREFKETVLEATKDYIEKENNTDNIKSIAKTICSLITDTLSQVEIIDDRIIIKGDLDEFDIIKSFVISGILKIEKLYTIIKNNKQVAKLIYRGVMFNGESMIYNYSIIPCIKLDYITTMIELKGGD